MFGLLHIPNAIFGDEPLFKKFRMAIYHALTCMYLGWYLLGLNSLGMSIIVHAIYNIVSLSLLTINYFRHYQKRWHFDFSDICQEKIKRVYIIPRRHSLTNICKHDYKKSVQLDIFDADVQNILSQPFSVRSPLDFMTD